MKNEDEVLLEKIEAEVMDESAEEFEDEEESEENLLKKLKKEKENKEKAEALWKAVQSGDDKHLTTRVASVLNRYPSTRNSDIALQIKYWNIYEGLTGNLVDVERLFKLERLTSIARARAKIQNEYKLFLAEESVRNRRRNKEDIEKEAQLLDKPSYKLIGLYADETGKNQDYIIVGGIWILEQQIQANIHRDYFNWTKRMEKVGYKIPEEFHFKKMNNKNEKELILYKEFFDLLLVHSGMISFKAVAVKRKNISKSEDEIIKDLYYQLAHLGISHEVSTKRIELPRQINITKDKESSDSDLVLEQLKQSLFEKFKLYYGEKLILNELFSLDSEKSIFLQFSDIFVASINRLYNVSAEKENNKDKLAKYVLNALDVKEIKMSLSKVEKSVDTEVLGDQAVLFIFE